MYIIAIIPNIETDGQRRYEYYARVIEGNITDDIKEATPLESLAEALELARVIQKTFTGHKFSVFGQLTKGE